MKKILLSLVVIITIQLSSIAQGGGFQRQTPQEQAAKIIHVLDSAFKLTPANAAKLDTALTILYKAQNDKMREIMSSGERPDRETMMAERKKYSDARDEMIKLMITKDQFDIWKNTIEPGMRPQRPGGGNRPSGN